MPRPPVTPSASTAAWKNPAAPGAAAEASLRQLESRIGQRWIAWVGAVVVFLSAVFFLKHAFDNDWIGPRGQIIICAVGAAIMATAGSYFSGKNWRILGQSLMGLGVAVLYATFYSAFQVYKPPVMGQETAFVFMVLVTIAGMALAVGHNALTLAFIAVLGGVLTPVLVSTGHDSRDVLFGYLTILNLGVMGVAFFRRWRLLDTLAMVGTYILYWSWFAEFYKPQGLGPALAWLAGFYVLFLVLPFVYHLVRKQAVTIERFIMAVANATFFASFAWYMLRGEHLETMGFVSLGMAAIYVALGAMLRRRLPDDAPSLFGAITMAVTFLTLAVPMELHTHGILLAWVVEAPVLAVVAYRFRYFPVRAFGAAILVVGIGRLFLSGVHWPLHHGLFVPFFNRQLLSALSVPAAMAAYALVHQVFRGQATVADRVLKLCAALGAGLIALIVLHAEVYDWLRNDWGAHAAVAAADGVTALWAVGALAYLLSGMRSLSSVAYTWGVGTLTLLVVLFLGMMMYGEDAGLGMLLFANGRFAAGLLGAAAIFAYALVMQRTSARMQAGPAAAMRDTSYVYLVAGLFALLVLLSAEVYTFCLTIIEEYVRAHRAGQMAISLVWSLYAAMLVVVGFWRRWRPIRLGGLALFGAAALKLALLDLTYLKDINRIVSFLVLGLLMLAASYLYHRLEKRLTSAAVTADGDASQAGGAS